MNIGLAQKTQSTDHDRRGASSILAFIVSLKSYTNGIRLVCYVPIRKSMYTSLTYVSVVEIINLSPVETTPAALMVCVVDTGDETVATIPACLHTSKQTINMK